MMRRILTRPRVAVTDYYQRVVGGEAFTYDAPHTSRFGVTDPMSERKYRQRGYQEDDRAREQRPKQEQPKRDDREGPRSPRMMAFGEKVKCASCGSIVAARIGNDSACPKCKSDLHTCRQCTYFDPGSRFECRKPLTARILNKGGRNTCELFAARTVVERETSSGKPTDARQAFANLFKK